MAPDFTNLIEGKLPHYAGQFKKCVAIIPNTRMFDKTSGNTGGDYLNFLNLCIEQLLNRRLSPFILLHEKNDLQISEKVIAKLSAEVPLVMEENPLYIKGLLGQCDFVIGSRFHGLVSALSQGVPAIGSGWSHKYQWLYKDYGVPELLMENSLRDTDLNKKIDMLIERGKRQTLDQNLKRASEQQKLLVRQMWEKIKETLC
jgi:colanic acid/amylovoran biosynthesis protein